MTDSLGYQVTRVRVTTLSTRNETIVLARPFVGNMFIMPKLGERIVVYGAQDEKGNADMFLSSAVEQIVRKKNGVEFGTRNSVYLVETVI